VTGCPKYARVVNSYLAEPYAPEESNLLELHGKRGALIRQNIPLLVVVAGASGVNPDNPSSILGGLNWSIRRRRRELDAAGDECGG